ncbi:MAG: muconate cycloisomerase [Alteromonadaceae bacterium]|nr:muconate cycloisomerase [Alteromonadaceae bacterium]
MATISQINSYIVDIPTIRPHKLSMTSMAVQSMVIVRIRDSEGREGIGEGTTIGGLAYGAESPESIKTNIDSYITPLLEGKGTDNPQVVMQDIHRAIRGNSIAKSAIETALLDLLGKTLNVPLSTLLGGALHSQIPCLWVLASGDTQRDIDEAKTMIATGRHNTFKLKIGNRSVQDDVAHVAAIKSALGNEISIRVDVNQAWTESDANLGMALLQEAGVDIVEQPTSAGQLDSLVRLADKYRIGVMADESISNINDCFELAKRGFSGSVALKIAKAGGPVQALKVATVCQAAGIDLYGGTLLEGSIGTAAAIHAWSTLPELQADSEMFGPLLQRDDIVTAPLNYHNFGVDVPRGPGLGLTLDEDKLKEYTRSY